VSAAEIIALVISGALLLYVLSGGADFGGGIWDLAARGPRAAAQRRLVERAIAPVWEANHVWLIVAVVLLFSAFPPAFAALANRLHVPLTALLLGIVLRGSALVFRQYGGPEAAHRWQRVFAISSAATPFFLGAVLGAVTSGAASEADRLAWLAPLPLAAGAAAAISCAYLAAVYLTVEAEAQAEKAGPGPAGERDRGSVVSIRPTEPAVRRGADEVGGVPRRHRPAERGSAKPRLGARGGSTDASSELVRDFRRRAVAAHVALAASVAACAAAAHASAPGFADRLFGSPWSAPLLAGAALAAGAAFAALFGRRFRLARAFAVLETSALCAAWGAAHAPALIAPDLTVANAAAPAETLEILVPVIAIGAVVIAPALLLLLRVFKASPPP